jgi:hypothetical protein
MFFYTVFGTKPSSMSIEITVNSIARGVIYVDNRVAPAVYTGSTGVAVFALNQGDDCFIRTHSLFVLYHIEIYLIVLYLLINKICLN